MGDAEYRFAVAPMVSATYTIAGGELVFKQGLRRTAIPLAQIRTFAVRENPGFLGFTGSQLLVKVAVGDGEKTRALTFDPAAQACQELLAALRLQLPAADATTIAWDAAAARLGVPVRPWYRALLEPRVTMGIILLGAGAFASTTATRTRDRSELLGRGLVSVTVTAVAIWLIVTGIRRSRAKRA